MICAHSLRANLSLAASPKDSGKIITSLSKNVKVHEEQIEELGRELLAKLESMVNKFPKNEFFPKPTDPHAVDWLFFLSLNNFCLWRRDILAGWNVAGHFGYYGLCIAINRAIKEGIDITNPKFYATINESILQNILRSDNDIPIQLLKRRLKCITEAGNILNTKYSGTFRTCIEACNHSAVKLVKLITTNFPSFCDEATYRGRRVSFYYRAQVLVGDLWSCFRNEGLGHFTDLNELSLCVGVRLPQVLSYYNVIDYNPNLRLALETDMLLEPGSEMEVDIRGYALYAGELMKQWMLENTEDHQFINSVVLTHLLWKIRRDHIEDIRRNDTHIHKTLSIYY